MFEKMSDGDVMVYLRNTMLALSKLSEERNIRVEVSCDPEYLFAYARAEDYEVVLLDGETKYNYQPIGTDERSRVCEWRDGIEVRSIRFGQAPKQTINSLDRF